MLENRRFPVLSRRKCIHDSHEQHPVSPRSTPTRQLPSSSAAGARGFSLDGIRRPYGADEVIRLRGRFSPEQTLARLGAERLWQLLGRPDYVAALGAMTGGQAVQMVRAGLQAIYLSGWQVAADANTAGRRLSRPEPLPGEQRPCRRPAHEQRAAPRRPDRLAEGTATTRLARADRRRRRGGLRRRAQRLRADEGDDRGGRRRRALRGPARRREEVRPPGRQGAGARPRSSCARWARRGWRPTSSASRRSSSPAPTRSARR